MSEDTTPKGTQGTSQQPASGDTRDVNDLTRLTTAPHGFKSAPDAWYTKDAEGKRILLPQFKGAVVKTTTITVVYTSVKDAVERATQAVAWKCAQDVRKGKLPMGGNYRVDSEGRVLPDHRDAIKNMSDAQFKELFALMMERAKAEGLADMTKYQPEEKKDDFTTDDVNNAG